MDSWRIVWRQGVAPSISNAGLEALRKALKEDDSRLIQGATTTPPPLVCVQDWPVEAADSIGYAFWQGDMGGCATVGEVEEFFAKVCFEADQRLGEAAAVRWYLNYTDDTPRNEMWALLLEEVDLVLSQRSAILS